MSGVGRRGEGPLSLCLPILPLPGGLKVPPSRAKGGGGTRPPSDASLGDKCHLHHLLQPAKCGGSAARTEGTGGTVSPWEQPLGTGTPTLTTGSCGDTEGVGSRGPWDAHGKQRLAFGEERRGQLGGGVSPSRSSVSVPTEHTKAVPLVTRTRPELPARWEHLLGERRSQSLPQVHSGDKHPKSRWGAQTGQAVTPHCPHTSPLPPSCLHAPHPLPAPPARRSGWSPSLPTPHPQPPWLFSMAERDV